MSFIRKNPRLAGVIKSEENVQQSTDSTRTGIPGLTPSLTGASALLASTGIPDLDVCLGAGLPAASLLTVFEDFPSSKANFTWSGIVRCFLAEGVATASTDLTRKDAGWIAIVGHDISGILDSLPRPEATSNSSTKSTTTDKEATPHSTSTASGDMKIAWRYEGLKEFDSNLKRPLSSSLTTTERTIGHTFDLGRKLEGLPKQISESSRALSLDLSCASDSSQCDYKRVWEFFLQALETNQRSGLGRIVIGSLGAPGFWNNCRCSTPCGPAWLVRAISNRIQDIEISHPCVVLVTIPITYLLENQANILPLKNNSSNASRLPTWIVAVENVSDAVIELKPLEAFTRKTTTKSSSSSLSRQYDGFIVIRKPLRRPNSFKPFIPETSNLAFKIKRRRFGIEKFHLPPALDDSENNSKPAASLCSSKASGSSSSHPLDF